MVSSQDSNTSNILVLEDTHSNLRTSFDHLGPRLMQAYTACGSDGTNSDFAFQNIKAAYKLITVVPVASQTTPCHVHGSPDPQPKVFTPHALPS